MIDPFLILILTAFFSYVLGLFLMAKGTESFSCIDEDDDQPPTKPE